MFKVFLLQSLAWLYGPLISLLLQAVAQISLCSVLKNRLHYVFSQYHKKYF